MNITIDIQDFKKQIEDLDLATPAKQVIQEHLLHRFPSQNHWKINKVTVQDNNTVDVNIPGANRAYQDITILPVNSRMLKIPLHQIDDSTTKFFQVKTNNNIFLASRGTDGQIHFDYVLKDIVRQKRDESIMPSDEEIIDKIITSI